MLANHWTKRFLDSSYPDPSYRSSNSKNSRFLLQILIKILLQTLSLENETAEKKGNFTVMWFPYKQIPPTDPDQDPPTDPLKDETAEKKK